MHTKLWLRRTAAVLAVALSLGLLAACGGARKSAQAPAESRTGMAGSAPAGLPVPAPAPAPAMPRPSEDAAVGKPTTAPQAAAPAQPANQNSQPGMPSLNDPSVQRKIILNADISLKVKSAKEALQEVQDLAAYNRGYVADATLSGSDDGGWNARVVLRIPGANYGDAITKLRALGDVRSERQWSQDVTEQFIDLEARVRILTEHEQRLRELALKADKFEDWLRLTQQINDTRIQIENLTGRLRLLGNQVEFSTINVTLVQPPGDKKEEPKATTLVEKMVRAFRESAKAMVEAGEGLLVFLAGFIPVGAVLVVLGFFGFVLLRAFVRRFGGRPAPPAGPPAGPPAT